MASEVALMGRFFELGRLYPVICVAVDAPTLEPTKLLMSIPLPLPDPDIDIPSPIPPSSSFGNTLWGNDACPPAIFIDTPVIPLGTSSPFLLLPSLIDLLYYIYIYIYYRYIYIVQRRIFNSIRILEISREFRIPARLKHMERLGGIKNLSGALDRGGPLLNGPFLHFDLLLA